MKPSLTLGPCTYPSPSKVFSHPCDDNSEEKEKKKKKEEEEKRKEKRRVERVRRLHSFPPVFVKLHCSNKSQGLSSLIHKPHKSNKPHNTFQKDCAVGRW